MFENEGNEQESIQVESESQSAPDPIKNVKEEFNRKLNNLSETNARLEAQLSALLAAQTSQRVTQPEKKVSVFDDEEAYARSVEERVASRVEKTLSAREQAQAKQAALMQSLVSEYPELSDGNSELTVKAVETYNSMSKEEKLSPHAYQVAVQQAALETGVKPKSKRKQSPDESYSLGSGSGAVETRASAKGRPSAAINPNTKMFAEAVGLNLDDPKNAKSAERIKNQHGRKSYNKWS